MFLPLLEIPKNLNTPEVTQFGFSSVTLTLLENTPNRFVVDIGVQFEDRTIEGKNDVFHVGDEISTLHRSVTIDSNADKFTHRGEFGIQRVDAKLPIPHLLNIIGVPPLERAPSVEPEVTHEDLVFHIVFVLKYDADTVRES